MLSSANGELGGDDPTGGQSDTPITATRDVEVVSETKYVSITYADFHHSIHLHASNLKQSACPVNFAVYYKQINFFFFFSVVSIKV